MDTPQPATPETQRQHNKNLVSPKQKRDRAERLGRQATRTPNTSGVDWRSRATCLEEDPELFFPVGNSGPALLQIEEAKTVCRRCPVTDTCLKWALETGQDTGVWGGMSENERRAIKRRKARARRAG